LAIVAGLGAGTGGAGWFGPHHEGGEDGKRGARYSAVRRGADASVLVPGETPGNDTLVNILGAWGIPCPTETPAREQPDRDLGPKGLRIIAISIDDGSAGDVQAFVKELGLTFEVLHDQSGGIQRVYQTTGVPESFLLDKNGVIVKKVIGEHPWSSPSNQRIVA